MEPCRVALSSQLNRLAFLTSEPVLHYLGGGEVGDVVLAGGVGDWRAGFGQKSLDLGDVDALYGVNTWNGFERGCGEVMEGWR